MSKPVLTIVLEPTEEKYCMPVDGQQVPVRVWRGSANGSLPIEAYVAAIVPRDPADAERLDRMVPEFMKRTRENFVVADKPKERGH